MWSSEWWRVPMAAVPSPEPIWPLPNVKPRFWDQSFGYKRPSTCSNGDCKRWHCGVDLTRAPGNTPVIATEAGDIVRVDAHWSGASVATFMRTENFFCVYGGLVKFSADNVGVREGDTVEQGQQLGRVHPDYGMVHFELYRPDPDRRANSRWWRKDPPPDGLLNPLNYIQVAAGMAPTLITPVQRHEALAALGHYTGPVLAPWSDDSKRALRDAQQQLGLDVDGKWGPLTEAAVQRTLATSPSADNSEQSTAGWWTTTRKIQLGLAVVGALGFAYVRSRQRRVHA